MVIVLSQKIMVVHMQQELEQKIQSQLISTASKKLEELIDGALKKIGKSKENDICRYLPNNGGYMHHFTLRKMKFRQPEALYDMIRKYILNPDSPQTVRPKQRAARGSKKKKEQIVLSKNDLDRVLQLAKNANDIDMLRKLMPKKDLKSIKKELIHSIKKNNICHALWTNYVEAVEFSYLSNQLN